MDLNLQIVGVVKEFSHEHGGPTNRVTHQSVGGNIEMGGSRSESALARIERHGRRTYEIPQTATQSAHGQAFMHRPIEPFFREVAVR